MTDGDDCKGRDKGSSWGSSISSEGLHISNRLIITTCKGWRRVGCEFLFRWFDDDDPDKLSQLSTILSSTHTLKWWLLRVHLAQSHAGAYARKSPSRSDMCGI
jgi:hypothetical protein